MRSSGPSFLAAIGLPRLGLILASAIVAGLVVGYALATLSDSDKSSPAPSLVSGGTTTTPSGAEIVKAVLMPATSASGKRRRRARVALTVTLRNGSDARRPAPDRPALIVGEDRVHVDPAAEIDAGGLLKDVPSLSAVTGVLRFETRGDVTDNLILDRRARLRFAGQTLPVRLVIDTQPDLLVP